MIRSFTLSQWDDIPWPDNEQASFLRLYLKPFVQQSTQKIIHNVHTELGIVIKDDVVLPFSIGAQKIQNGSYVCAPQSHYIDYAMEEVPLLNGVLRKAFSYASIFMIRGICTIGAVNKVIMINNWLLSTNLYPSMTHEMLEELKVHFIQKYPQHTLLFRSITMKLHDALIPRFLHGGFQLVLSRRVHLFFGQRPQIWKKNNIKNDQRLRRKTTYKRMNHDDFTVEDMTRVKELYDMLYLDKYSALNPNFSIAFITHVWKYKLWTFSGYRKNGSIDSVCGTWGHHGVRVAPLIGYDTQKETKEGLYRLAYLDMLESGDEAGELVHCSAGVAQYKQNRGAESHLEYNAVYHNHLPFYRKLPWLILQLLMKKFVQPMMIKNNL